VPRPLRLLVLADDPDWHTRRLVAAARERGVETFVCALADCRFGIGPDSLALRRFPPPDPPPQGRTADSAGPLFSPSPLAGEGRGEGNRPKQHATGSDDVSAIIIPGLPPGALPDAAFVRTVAAGSFEQVTFRLAILHALEASGVPVVNAPRAIERCVDKGMTSFLLHRAGLPTPPTCVTESAEIADRWRDAVDGDVVLKPLFGSQGRGLRRLRRGDLLPNPLETAGVYYLQRFVGRDAAWHDIRVFVVGGRPVAAMRRHGRSWITNVARGGRCETVPATGRFGDLAVAAAAAVGADYAGVDLIEDADGGVQVLEVNSMPAWKGLQSVTDETDVAAVLIGHVLARAEEEASPCR
jgi:tetrahydromethanopterin:alpha-L-glutamate ligase